MKNWFILKYCFFISEGTRSKEKNLKLKIKDSTVLFTVPFFKNCPLGCPFPNLFRISNCR